MKFIKLAIIAFLLSISAVQAQETEVMQEDLYASSQIEINSDTSMAVEENSMMLDLSDFGQESASTEEKIYTYLLHFISGAILAFFAIMLFPKFFKRTSDVLMQKNKFRIAFEGAKVVFILTTIALVGVLAQFMIHTAILSAAIVLAIYVLGLPVFSLGVLDWVFNKKSIKFEKQTNFNKLVSLVSINLILLVVVLPFVIFDVNINMPIYENSGFLYTMIHFAKVFIISLLNHLDSVVAFIMSLVGMGMLSIHLRAVIEKNKKKL